MLVSISDASLSFPDADLFENLNLQINENEKIALIGRNGCGKTSILRAIAGENIFSSGNIVKSKNIEIAYLRQQESDTNQTLAYDYLLQSFSKLIEQENKLKQLNEKISKDHNDELLEEYASLQEDFRLNGGYEYEKELKLVFYGFGFKEEDLNKPLSSFSGGEREKIAFASLLLKKPDLLMLDEPTNHLDLETIEWLENYLHNYKKALLLVSHDRFFLDKVVNITYELEYGELTKYNGNYSYYVQQKEKDTLAKEKAYKRQEKEFKRLEELIEKFRYKDSKAKFAQSKIKYLERQEKLDSPKKADLKTFKAKFKCRLRGGNDVLDLDDFAIGYDTELFKVNLHLKRGQRLCVMGSNGCGKSALLKTITGQNKALGGYMLFGHQIEYAYFAQDLQQFKQSNTLIEELWESKPDLTRQEIRNVLGAFRFSNDEVFKSVSVLSGGELVRLSLAKIMLKEANLLILDEPTNHLDIVSKEALESALKDYEGTIIFVSHDRYFIKEIADSCLLIKDKQAIYYPDGYGDYIDGKKEEEVQATQVEKEVKINTKPKSQYDIRKIESAISLLEEELETKRDLRYEPEYYQDSKKMKELDAEIDDIHNKISHLLKEWEKAMEEEENKKK